jgi:hypothetical protein
MSAKEERRLRELAFFAFAITLELLFVDGNLGVTRSFVCLSSHAVLPTMAFC